MTKTEAILAMKYGKKVTHRFFTSDEYITMTDDVIVDEKGFRLKEFWDFRTEITWDDDWSLFEDSEEDPWVECTIEATVPSDEPAPYDGFNFWSTDIDNHFPTAIGQKLLCTANYWGDYGLYRICKLEPINCLLNCEEIRK